MSAEGAGEDRTHRHRVFRFGRFSFNEGSQELLVDGNRRPLESKPRLLLLALLSQSRMVVSKSDLKRAIWPEKQFVEEGSLSTAVYNLRLALEDKGHQIIGAMPGIGYRMLLPVAVNLVDTEADASQWQWLREGATVPWRPSWILHHALGASPASKVWIARHENSQEVRVFKFGNTAERLDALKREAALSRVLRTRLGERDDLVPVLEWNFEDQPYFIEASYGGLDLQSWLNGRGARADLASRMALVAMLARTVGDAHGAGVLHGDIRPANILVAESGERPAHTKLVNFGGGGLTQAAQTEALSLSVQELTDHGAATRSGSLLYVAPELLRGGEPTAAGDVYALGILLYQMVAGDLEKPLAAGWEDDVTDEILRGDIAAAAAGDLARRIPSAAVFAERLEQLDARRAKLAQDREDAARAMRLAEADRRARLRRPWMALAAAALVLGIVATGAAALRAIRERDEVSRQARIVQAVNLFLTDDLLGRGNPIMSGKANETLMEAVSNAEARIPFRLATEPAIAASIYYSLAQAFAGRGAYKEARIAYNNAAAAFKKAQGPQSPDATIMMLRRAEMEASASDAGSLDRAKEIVAQAAKRIDGMGARAPETRVWMLAAQGTLQLVGGDVATSQKQLKQAADLADSMPEIFDADTRLLLRQREAFAEFRLGHWDEAQALFTDILKRKLALHGPLHPDTLIVRLNLAQVLMARGASASAVHALNDNFIHQLTAVFGPEHHAVLTALAARARSLMMLGRYEQALRDNEQVHRAAVAKQGENSQFAILALTDVAEAQCRVGQTDAGTDSAARAYAAATKSFPNTPAIAQDVGMTRALCLIAAGKYADASPLLERIDVKAVSEFEADPDVDAKRDLMLADIAAGSGQMAKARSLLAKPERVFAGADADPYLRAILERLRAAAVQQKAAYSKVAPVP